MVTEPYGQCHCYKFAHIFFHFYALKCLKYVHITENPQGVKLTPIILKHYSEEHVVHRPALTASTNQGLDVAVLGSVVPNRSESGGDDVHYFPQFRESTLS